MRKVGLIACISGIFLMAGFLLNFVLAPLAYTRDTTRPLKRSYLPQSTRQSWAAKIELAPPPEGPVIPIPTPPPPPLPPTGYQALVSDIISRVGLVNLWVFIIAGLVLEAAYIFWRVRQWRQSRIQKRTKRLSEPN